MGHLGGVRHPKIWQPGPLWRLCGASCASFSLCSTIKSPKFTPGSPSQTSARGGRGICLPPSHRKKRKPQMHSCSLPRFCFQLQRPRRSTTRPPASFSRHGVMLPKHHFFSTKSSNTKLAPYASTCFSSSLHRGARTFQSMASSVKAAPLRAPSPALGARLGTAAGARRREAARCRGARKIDWFVSWMRTCCASDTGKRCC
jgi:hypothetical protein